MQYTFVYEKTKVLLDYQTIESESGNEVAVMRFEAPSTGLWLSLIHI